MIGLVVCVYFDAYYNSSEAGGRSGFARQHMPYAAGIKCCKLSEIKTKQTWIRPKCYLGTNAHKVMKNARMHLSASVARWSFTRFELGKSELGTKKGCYPFIVGHFSVVLLNTIAKQKVPFLTDPCMVTCPNLVYQFLNLKAGITPTSACSLRFSYSSSFCSALSTRYTLDCLLGCQNFLLRNPWVQARDCAR